MLLLVGCEGRVELVGNLNDERAVDAVVALYRAGISARREKVSGGRGGDYRITVFDHELTRAEEVLHELRLLDKHQVSFEEFTEPKGFTPNTPEIAALRAEHAIGLRLERLLAALPGVITARVHVTGSPRSAGSVVEAVSGVTVVLRYVSRSKNMPFSEADVRKIVLQAFPSIPRESISIQSSRVALPDGGELFGVAGEEAEGTIEPLVRRWPFVFRVPEKDLEKAIKQIVFYMVAFCFAGMVLGVWWGMSRRRSRSGSRRELNGKKNGGRAADSAGLSEKTSVSLPGIDPAGPAKRKKLGTGSTQVK